jgi:hypothetical protein
MWWWIFWHLWHEPGHIVVSIQKKLIFKEFANQNTLIMMVCCFNYQYVLAVLTVRLWSF